MKLSVRSLLILSLTIKCTLLFSQSPPSYINKLYNNLFYSLSNGEFSKPTLLVVDDLNNNKKVRPEYSPGRGTITIGKSLIDLTGRLGKDSTAARVHIFCHELAHLFLKHGYSDLIGIGFASNEVKKKFSKASLMLEDSLSEIQADYWAFFYAHVAGYKTIHVVPQLLDSIYKFYNLKDSQLKSYPTLSDRKKYANKAYEKMKLMCETFDFANIALMHGDYNFAAGIFELIRDEGFKSREIFSNLGVAHLLRAIELADEGEIDFKLPLQIDLNTRLRQEATRSLSDEDAIDELNKAIENFQTAIRIDESYFYGYLNLAVSYWFKKDDFNYEVYLIKAKKYCPEAKIKDLIVLESIVKCKSTDDLLRNIGFSTLDSLAGAGNKLAAINFRMLRKETNIEVPFPPIIDSLIKIKLPGNFNNSTNILKGVFTKEILTCKQMDGTIINRRWKYSKGDNISGISQYIFKEQLNVLDKDLENRLIESAEKYLEGANFYYLLLNNVLLKVNDDKRCEIQIVK